MKTVEILDKLRRKTVFGIPDIERLGNVNRNNAKLILNRLKKKELIRQITKNVYTTKDDIFLIASNIVHPSYISFWSASYYLGFTEQIVNMIQVATTRRVRMINYEGYDIKFVPLKYFFGQRKIRTAEGEIFIVENEKLLIDAFLHPNEMGNFDEILKIFRNAEISENKIVEYLKRVKVQSVIKRVGYLLEKEKGLDISSYFYIDRNYARLNPFSTEARKIDSKWRVKL